MRLSIGQESGVLPAFPSPGGARGMNVKGHVKELSLDPVIAVWQEKTFARLRGTAFGHAEDLLLSIPSVYTSREMGVHQACEIPVLCRLIWCGTPSA